MEYTNMPTRTEEEIQFRENWGINYLREDPFYALIPPLRYWIARSNITSTQTWWHLKNTMYEVLWYNHSMYARCRLCHGKIITRSTDGTLRDNWRCASDRCTAVQVLMGRH